MDTVLSTLTPTLFIGMFVVLIGGIAGWCLAAAALVHYWTFNRYTRQLEVDNAILKERQRIFKGAKVYVQPPREIAWPMNTNTDVGAYEENQTVLRAAPVLHPPGKRNCPTPMPAVAQVELTQSGMPTLPFGDLGRPIEDDSSEGLLEYKEPVP